jgi:putative membrane protein
MMGFGLILVILLIGAIFIFVQDGSGLQGLFRSRRTDGFSTGSGDADAREILDRRYARGEITREEYLSIKKDLV